MESIKIPLTQTSQQKFLGEALTYDDVLLVPAYSEVLPREVDISTQLTRNIRLNVPIVSAAMDTVTDAGLAIAIARQGGIGIVHKNMSIAEQAAQVRKVKRSESGMIIDPVTLRGDALIGDALALMRQHKIGGIPIVDGHNQLIGILTNRDLRFETRINRPVHEVMTKLNMITAPVGTTLQQARAILQQHKIEKLPVVDEDQQLAGLSAIHEASKAIEGSGVPIVGDGGIRYTGDIAKAVVAGASTIMAGSLFAGVEEAPGETIIYDGRKFKIYRGMGSLGAMEMGSKDRYFQDVEDDIKKLVPEGIEGRVPYKGTLAEVMVQYIGGLRAGMGYCGAANIEEMKKTW